MQTELPSISPPAAMPDRVRLAMPVLYRRILFVLLAGLMLLSATLVPTGDIDDSWSFAWIGAYCGQVGLLAAWGAFASQPATMRLPRTLGWMSLMVLATAWTASRTVPEAGAMTVGYSLMPLAVFLPLTLVFALVRRFFHWQIRLVPADQHAVHGQRTQFTIQQSLAWIAGAAVLLGLTRCVLSDVDPIPGATSLPMSILEVLLESLIGAVALVVLAIPVTFSMLGLVLGERRVRFATATAVVASLLALVQVWLMSPPATAPGTVDWLQDLGTTLIPEAALMAFLFGTLLVGRMCGYRFVRRRRSETPPAALSEQPAPPVSRPGIGRVRFASAVATLVLIAVPLVWTAVQQEFARQRTVAEWNVVRPWKHLGVEPTVEKGKITHLSFTSGQPVSDEAIGRLASLPAQDVPAGVSFQMCPLRDAQLERLAKQRLMGLHFKGTRITDAGLRHLAGMDSLVSLDLTSTAITDAGLAHLSRLGRLKYLYLDATKITGEGLRYLRDLHNLEVLNLQQTGVRGPGLAQLATLQSLNALDLSQTPIVDDDLKQLPVLTKLAYIGLSTTKVTDRGLENLKTLKNLVALNLAQTAITDQGLENLDCWPHLEVVVLEGTKVSDRGLARLQAMKHLKTLTISSPGVTQGAVDRLQQALPECKVTYAPSSPTVAQGRVRTQ